MEGNLQCWVFRGRTSNPHLIVFKTSTDLPLLSQSKRAMQGTEQNRLLARCTQKNPDLKATKIERYIFQIMTYLVEVKCLRQVHWKIRLVQVYYILRRHIDKHNLKLKTNIGLFKEFFCHTKCESIYSYMYSQNWNNSFLAPVTDQVNGRRKVILGAYQEIRWFAPKFRLGRFRKITEGLSIDSRRIKDRGVYPHILKL